MLASTEGLRQGERMRKPPCDLYLARLPPGEFQAGYQEVEGISLGYLQVDGRRMFALAQVLSDLFKDIPRTTISKRMESLRIKSRRCDLRELRTLKAMQSLPSRAVQGSLISREDLAVLCQEARRRRRAEPAPPLPLPGSKQGTSAGYSSDSDSSLEGSSSGSDSSGDSSSGDEEEGAGSSDSDSGDSVQSTRYRQAALPEPEPSLLRLSQHLWARSLQGQAWGVAGRGRGPAEGEQGSSGGERASAPSKPRSAAGHSASAPADRRAAPAQPRSAPGYRGAAKTEPKPAFKDQGSASGHARPAAADRGSAQGDPRSALADSISTTKDLGPAAAFRRSSHAHPRSPARDLEPAAVCQELSKVDTRTAAGDHRSPLVPPRTAAADRRTAQVDPSSPARDAGSAAAYRRSAQLDRSSPARDLGTVSEYRGSAQVDPRVSAGDLRLVTGDVKWDERNPKPAEPEVGPKEGDLGSAENDLRPSKKIRGPTEEDLRPSEVDLDSSKGGRGLPEVAYAQPLSSRGLVERDLRPGEHPESAEGGLESAGRDLGSQDTDQGSADTVRGFAEVVLISAEDGGPSPEGDPGSAEAVEPAGCVSPRLAGGDGALPSSPSPHPKSPGRDWEPAPEGGELRPGEPSEEGTDSKGPLPSPGQVSAPCSPPRDPPEPRREHFDRLIRQSKLWCYAKGFSADGKGFRLALAKPPSSKRARSGSTSSKKAFKGSGSERNAKRRRLSKGTEPGRRERAQPGRKRKSGPRKKSAAPAPGRRAFTLLEHFPCTPSLVLGADGDLCPAYSLGASRSTAVPKPHPVWRWQLGGNAIPVPPSLKFRSYPLGDFW